MNDTLQNLDGTWVIAKGGYRTVNGAVAPPADPMLMQYDPWAPFRANLREHRTVPQPYVELLNLNDHLRAGQPKELLVPQWCDHFGQLGLLPILCTEITFQRSDRAHPWGRYLRGGNIWWPELSDKDGIFWADSFQFDKSYQPEIKPGVGWLDPFMGRHQKVGIEFLSEFLPVVAGVDPPRPLEAQFWRVYREPLERFTGAVTIFGWAVQMLSDNPPAVDPRFDYADVVKTAHGVLAFLASTVAPAFDLDPAGHSKRITRSPGLLASFALMFMLDRLAGRRVRRCAECESWFVSGDSRAKYCRPKCRKTTQMRSMRDRNKRTEEK
jgi:hypothetical protein